jgi:hypothetical protein
MIGRQLKRRKLVTGDVADDPPWNLLETAKWAGMDDNGSELAIGRHLWPHLKIIMLTPEALEFSEKVLKEILEKTLVETNWPERVNNFGKVGKEDDGEVEWHNCPFVEEELRRHGFPELCEPGAVMCGNLVLKLFLPSDKPLYLLDSAIAYVRRSIGDADRQGFARVGRGKTKPTTGTMWMSGSHYSQSGKGFAMERRLYAANAKVDEELNKRVNKYIREEALAHEKRDVPAVSRLRAKLVKESDPHGLHSVRNEADDTATFDISLTDTYVTGPHTEPNAVQGLTESIFLSSETLQLPKGHKWLFAGAGVMCRLDQHQSCRIYVPPSVWHGTLPTHSTEPSAWHGGVGSAIVVKKDMVSVGRAEYHE